ncbi:hypothetical protein V494_01170 [Pseudogymnoascus sp. VKM F-4513 (FW-928)]|nr:hypothetical protein V494_01170 [Pseudogymnoascus sp. VKM F-4513 (FW-928)]
MSQLSSKMADLKASSDSPVLSDQNPSTNNPDLNGVTLDIENKAGSRSMADTQQKKDSAFKSLGLLDRFLALWIFLAMLIGILLGNFVENVGPALQKGKFVGVSVPIAIGLLVMMYPILCKVQYEALHHVFRKREIWIQIGFSIVVNWIVAPFVMMALAWAFLPDKQGLREGLILVGIARCIAMVLIWTGLAGGDNEYCAILVAVNSFLQIVLFAPLALLFIKVISHGGPGVSVSYSTVATSVGVFLGIPLGAAILTRFTLLKIGGERFYNQVFLKFAAPWSLIGLLFTILVLFASQGHQVVHQIVSVVRVAAPLVVYFAVIFFLTLLVTHKLGFGYKLAATQSFTAASNNFELAIAVAVATFGADSDQALAATVGPLIEVPVLLGLVYVPRGENSEQSTTDQHRLALAKLGWTVQLSPRSPSELVILHNGANNIKEEDAITDRVHHVQSTTLARVRDNQRRCRARKQEYVVELEQKIRDLQAAGDQANIEKYQNTVQRLEAENKRLRVLLNLAWFSESQVEAQLQEGHNAGYLEGSLNHIEKQGPLYTGNNVNEYTEAAPHEAPTGLLPDRYDIETFDDLLNISLELPEEEFNFDLSNSTLGTSAVGTPVASQIFDGNVPFPYVSLLSDNQVACPPSASPLITGDLGHLNAAKSDSDTTLCSVAYDLVRQHNKKGVDMMEICIRLWNGLMKGDEGEGYVIIVGSGFSGICSGLQLQSKFKNSRYEIFDKAEDIGGTWSKNTYPNLSCDIPSQLYFFSFSLNSAWSTEYATQSEILDYIKRIANSLQPHTNLRQECVSSHWLEEASLWSIQFVGLTTNKPIRGKDVVVIGNGASANQFVPWILEKVEIESLTQVVRSEQWIAPKNNKAVGNIQQWVFGNLPLANRLYRSWLALKFDLAFIAFKDNILGRHIRSALEVSLSAYIRRTAPPQYHSDLIPSYSFGTKRPILDHGYLACLSSPKVNLVKSKSTTVVGGNRLADDNGNGYPADIIILANGYKTQQLLMPMKITGLDGVELRELWENTGTSAYMGVMVPGFPNLFLLTGPNTLPSGHSTLLSIENSVAYILRLLEPQLAQNRHCPRLCCPQLK